MSLKILYSPIFNSMNYTKYFKPQIYEQYKSINKSINKPINKQLTFNAKVDYTIMKYEISEYYMYNYNNINIFKIIFNIKYNDINIIEKNTIGSYNNKNILLSNHILCDNKNINYNNINKNILDTLNYIKFLEKINLDINCNNMLKNSNLLSDNLLIYNNILYKSYLYKICNELNKLNDNEINDLLYDIKSYEHINPIYIRYVIIQKAININNNNNNKLIKLQINILINILKYIYGHTLFIVNIK